MKINRHRQIQQLLRVHQECSVEFLAAELRVSDMTVRRDLQILAKEGLLVRTRGGASQAERVLFDFPFLREAEQNRSQKGAIAECAARLVEDGQSVMLDSGTTTLAVARHLARRKRLVVITTSLPIAAVLQPSVDVETILLGGIVRRDSPDLTGPLTEGNLDAFHADLAFIGADAVGPDGTLYNASMTVGRMLTKMISRAGAVYVVADSSKIGRTALSRFGSAASIQGLITDGDLGAEERKTLEAAGVRVILAPVAEVEPAALEPYAGGTPS